MLRRLGMYLGTIYKWRSQRYAKNNCADHWMAALSMATALAMYPRISRESV